MSTSRVGTALRQLSELFHGRRVSERSDGQLLARFLSDRDETAFAALVQRHGNLVLGVCHRILGNTHDAEDAFQASFLVLIRSAAAIRRQESLASWLYGVAHRTALKARTAAARRRTHERQAAMPSTASTEPTWDDLRPVLDEELGQLPERYRTPLILCYLEGKSKDEAARELDCPPGTISSRLTRARELLRGRLARRGITLSALGLVALLEQSSASAAVSPGLALATLESALKLAAGKSAGVNASIMKLTEGVLQAMLISKIRMTVLAIAVPVLLLAGWAVTYGVLAEEKSGSGPMRNVADKNAQAKDADKPLTDEQAIQGTWRRVVLSELTGKVKEEETWVFKGQKFWRISKDGAENGPNQFSLTPESTPKGLDLIYPPAGAVTVTQTTQCIYELNGDTLKVGSAEAGPPKGSPFNDGGLIRSRPSGFDKANTRVFKREPAHPQAANESRFVKEIVDPQLTSDLVVGQSRILRLKETPKRVALADETKVSFTFTNNKELLLTGKEAGKTDLTLWFATDAKSADAVLSYLVTVRADDAAAEARERSDPPKTGKAAGERLKKIIELKRDAAAEEARLRYLEFEAGRGTLDTLMECNRHLVDAECELATDKKTRLKALTEYFELMQKIEAMTKERFDAGKIAGQDLAAIRYRRYEAEQRLEEEKAK